MTTKRLRNQDVYLDGTLVYPKAIVLLDLAGGTIGVKARSDIGAWNTVISLHSVVLSRVTGELHYYQGLDAEGTMHEFSSITRQSGCGCGGSGR